MSFLTRPGADVPGGQPGVPGSACHSPVRSRIHRTKMSAANRVPPKTYVAESSRVIRSDLSHALSVPWRRLASRLIRSLATSPPTALSKVVKASSLPMADLDDRTLHHVSSSPVTTNVRLMKARRGLGSAHRTSGIPLSSELSCWRSFMMDIEHFRPRFAWNYLASYRQDPVPSKYTVSRRPGPVGRTHQCQYSCVQLFLPFWR